MPDEALLGKALHHAVDHLVRSLVLLVAADDFDAAMLLVGREEREVLQDVEHNLWTKHPLNRRLDVPQFAFVLVVVVPPRTPHVDGHSYGTVAIETPLGGERKHVRDEHRGRLLLVNLVDLERTIEPCN